MTLEYIKQLIINGLLSSLANYESKVLTLLDDSRVDHKVALVFCRQSNFQPGLIKLLSDGPVANLSDLLSVYLELGKHKDARKICEENGFRNTDLWRKALSFWATRSEKPEIVSELKVALPVANKALPLISIVMMLKDSNAPISIIKDLVLKHLDNDNREITKAKENIATITQSLKKTKERTHKLKHQATVFKLNKCKLCGEDLTLPSVHFLCGHSFHKVIRMFKIHSSWSDAPKQNCCFLSGATTNLDDHFFVDS